MRNASGHQGEKKSRSEEKKKANRNTYDISLIRRVTRKFHFVIVVQNNGKEMHKNVWCTPIVVFC